MPETDQKQPVKVIGPDKKTYNFPSGTTKEKAVAYFKKKGIGVKTDDKKPVENKSAFNPGPDPLKVKATMEHGTKSASLEGVDYFSKSLPSVMGAGFSMAAGTKKNPAGAAMAGLGGMAGASANELIQRIIFGRSGDGIQTGRAEDTNMHEIKNILWEGVKQAGLEVAGRKTGEIFFNLLNKLPHAEMKNGIKFLPSELNGGRMSKYIEDILTNLSPSAKTMEEFKSKQNTALIGATEKLAKGFSRFQGTTEQMGKLLQDTYRASHDAMMKALNSAPGSANFVKAFGTPALRQQYEKEFENQLAKEILKTNKPELIGGYLRTSALEETRTMVSKLGQETPKVLNAVRTRIMRDVLQEVLTGESDPILKATQAKTTQFAGNKLKQAMDKIGEEKLKILYGEVNTKKIEDFVQLVGKTGGPISGLGRFLNLIFAFPIRMGISVKPLMKVTGMAVIINRAAKVMTSTEGMRLYENVIRATGTNIPRAINLAREEYQAYIKKQDEEYQQEMHDVEETYYQNHPDEAKYRNKKLEEQRKLEEQQNQNK